MKKDPRNEPLYALEKALENYAKSRPKQRKPKGKPVIVPTLAWSSADNFRVGYNMQLTCWTGPHGEIPVIVVPIHNAEHHLKVHTNQVTESPTTGKRGER